MPLLTSIPKFRIRILLKIIYIEAISIFHSEMNVRHCNALDVKKDVEYVYGIIVTYMNLLSTGYNTSQKRWSVEWHQCHMLKAPLNFHCWIHLIVSLVARHCCWWARQYIVSFPIRFVREVRTLWTRIWVNFRFNRAKWPVACTADRNVYHCNEVNIFGSAEITFML